MKETMKEVDHESPLRDSFNTVFSRGKKIGK